MTIEQPPELNRFVDPSIPLTWAYRWRQFQLMLPIWGFIWLCLIETGVTKAWFADRLTWDFISILLGCCLFMVVMVFGLVEIQIRIRQRSKRILQIKEQKIVIKPAKQPFIRWQQVSKFQFEPVAEMPGLTILTIFGFRLKKAAAPRALWSVVLDNSTQVKELLGCLQLNKATTSASYEIETLANPLPIGPVVPLPMLGMSLYFGGLYLLLHGGPLLVLVLFGGHSGHNSSHSDMSAAKKAWLGNLLTRHFSSVAQFDHFVFWLGLGLTCLGIIFLVWGSYLIRFRPHNIPQLTIQR